MLESPYNCRVAARRDAKGIFRVLAEVAPEIPLLIDTRERKKRICGIIHECVKTCESWVATVSGGVVVGFILAEPDKMERFCLDNQALHLRYVGISNACRRQGIFRALIQQVMNRGVPLTATVKAANQCQMAALLQRVGFQRPGDRPDEEQFRWQPG